MVVGAPEGSAVLGSTLGIKVEGVEVGKEDSSDGIKLLGSLEGSEIGETEGWRLGDCEGWYNGGFEGRGLGFNKEWYDGYALGRWLGLEVGLRVG